MGNILNKKEIYSDEIVKTNAFIETIDNKKYYKSKRYKIKYSILDRLLL